ncbi:hypothetical protein bb8_p11 [Bordetella phage vB_BbrP_BB8]|uniref:Uncharacterized protein n=1 Tax=Bordetella phage vB_BbrP_BB8 TaxID=2587820 RepID=A0A4Y5TNR6_9CAUD|nr:hypothetical protein bb8_p11 [Bordetella phage vB_BbrP_BB8]
MSNITQEQLGALESLFGKGEDTEGLIGKKVRALKSEKEVFGSLYYAAGDLAEVVFIDEDGGIWADFEDQGNAEVNRNNPANLAVWCVGDPDREPNYEVIG